MLAPWMMELEDTCTDVLGCYLHRDREMNAGLVLLYGQSIIRCMCSCLFDRLHGGQQVVFL